MKCPGCGYIDGWDPETVATVNGLAGDFWQLPIEMTRTQWGETQHKFVVACPQCKTLFIDD